jgi:hypothetical protein
MHNHLRVALASMLAKITMAAQAELNIIGDVIIQNEPQPQGQPNVAIQPQPMRAINVPKPTRSADGAQETEQDATPRPDTLALLNEDLMRGAILSIDPNADGVRWQHPNVKSAIDFDLSSVDRITLGDATPTAADGNVSEVILTNGDKLRGAIKDLSADTLTFSTWYAGDVRIKRVMIESLSPSAIHSGIIYEGPTSLAGWTHLASRTRPSWQYNEGAFYALQATPIGRQIAGMPDSARIEFNASWRGYPQFNVAFYSDNVQHQNGNCYMLQVTGQSIYMQRYSSASGSQNLGNANIARFQHANVRTAKFTILVDKTARKLALLIDDELIRQWNDPSTIGGLGNAIVFQAQAQGNLKIEGITISVWDGKMPAAAKEEEEEERGQDRIHFLNNDKVSGTVQTIIAGQVAFETAYVTLTVPVERVGLISLSQKTPSGLAATRTMSEPHLRMPAR